MVRAIYGADKADSGVLKVKGEDTKISSPLDAMKAGMAYLPEDRKKEGIIADLSVRENIILALQAKRGMFKLLSRKQMEEFADKYLILDEPTRGIDIGTKTEIQKLVLQLADEGKAVTFISSEIEEMLRTCSRMAVLRDGKKVGEIEEEDLSQESIMKAIAGGDE